MKKLILAIAALACLPLRADQVANLYKQGLTAVEEGNVKGAEMAFTEVLRLQPKNPHARYQLAELKRNQGSIAARARSRQLAQYQIDQINFDATEVSEALAALSMMIEKKSEGKFAPNFMIQDPGGRLGERTISLQVKNLPAKAAFDMILQQAGAGARYEEHAIVVTPRATSETERAAAPVKPAKGVKGLPKTE